MLKHWIWLTNRPGIGVHGRAALLRLFGTAEQIYRMKESEYLAAEGFDRRWLEGLLDKSLDEAEKILTQCDNKEIRLLTYADPAYPNRLKNIVDPPALLYYRGTLPDIDREAVIAVVGSRRCSAYGLLHAKQFSKLIASSGGIVVSGGARGIDSMALSGALDSEMPVLCVLGCGVDVVYPPENRGLFRQIESHGCILSEFKPGTRPDRGNFPVRNRILSGLALGVLVVEAPEKSGALITARLAAEQGRDVFAVPGNIDQPSFVGSNRLLRDGAIMVSSGWDVLSEYEALFPDKIRKEDAPAHQTAYPDEVRKAAEAEKPLLKVAQKLRLPRKNENLKKDLAPQGIDKTPSAPYSDVGSVRPKLSPEEQTIVDALSGGQRLVDDVIAETGLSTGKLLSSLTMLELKGIIKRLPGKRIVLSGK